MLIPVNQFRTDWCNPWTGRIEFRQCHDLERNYTVNAQAVVQQNGNGTKYLVKCEEQGPFGVIFSETLVKEEPSLQSTAVPGFCAEEEKMYKPDDEWIDGSFVKLCHPDTLQVVITHCISSGTVIPRGGNKTREYDIDKGRAREFSECLAVGDRTEIKKSVEVFHYAERTPMPILCSIEEDTSCYPRVNGTMLWDVRVEAGNEVVIDGIVHGCFKRPEYKLSDHVVGCVSQYGNFLVIGENITEKRRLNAHSTMRYTSYCAAEGKYDATVKYVREDASEPLVFPERDVLECAPGVTNGELYNEDGLRKRCRFNHRGVFNSTVEACLVINNAGVTVAQIEVDQHKLLDDSVLRCSKDETGRYLISPVPKCENGKLLGEEWVENSLVHSCVEYSRNQVHGEIIGCVSNYGNFLQIGENATEGVENDKIFNSFCLLLKGGARRVVEPVRDTNVPGVPRQVIYPVKGIPHCGSNPDDRSGQLILDGNIVFSCEIDHRGRQNITLVGCRVVEGKIDELVKLGEVTTIDSTKVICTATGPSDAYFEPHERSEIDENTCANGRKHGEEWVVDKLVHGCVEGDQDQLDDKVIGCISYYGNFLEIGENVTEGYMINKVYNSFCLPLEGGAKYDFEQIKDFYFPDEPEQEQYPRRDIPHCGNDTDNRSGYKYIDDYVLRFCQIDHRGRKNDTIIGCMTSERDFTGVPLNEVVVVNGTEKRCIPTSDGSAVLAVVDSSSTTSVPPSTKNARANPCEKGREVGAEYVSKGLIKACEKVNTGPYAVKGEDILGVVVRACVVKGVRIPVGEKKVVNFKSCECRRNDGVHPAVKPMSAKLVCSKVDPTVVTTASPKTQKTFSTTAILKTTETTSIPKSTELYTEDPSLDCSIPGKMDKEWTEIVGDFTYLRLCKLVQLGGERVPKPFKVACLSRNGDRINVGEELDDLKGLVSRCVRVHYYEARVEEDKYVPKVGLCQGKYSVADRQVVDLIVRICMPDQVQKATECYYGLEKKKSLFIGEILREGSTQYSCEKRGKYDAELVIKSLQQLCEDGDETADAWIDNEVLRDCVRSGKIHRVHARLCILSDERIIEIGQNITEEYETYKCERKGLLDAELIHDHSKIHPDYFTTSDTCKNGRKVGEEWTESGIILRACRTRKGRSTVVDLGCLKDDGSLLAVGREATWQVPASPGQMAVSRTLTCLEGKPGFGAVAEIGEVPGEPNEYIVRYCANGKREGDQWEVKNILFNCTEFDDALTIVAIRCVFGNDTMEIGESRKESDFSYIECAGVGEHGAAVIVDFPKPYQTHCENGKKIGEEWEEHGSRKVCRSRNETTIAVVLGCVLEKGKFIKLGDIERETVQMPGYEIHYFTKCSLDANGNAVATGGKSQTRPRQDKKNPCGDKKHEEVWASGRFLKKCKVIGDNYLSAVTIGCVTVKETHMLEGQYLVEDDYDLKCGRNGDGKLELHYSFTVVEK